MKKAFLKSVFYVTKINGFFKEKVFDIHILETYYYMPTLENASTQADR